MFSLFPTIVVYFALGKTQIMEISAKNQPSPKRLDINEIGLNWWKLIPYDESSFVFPWRKLPKKVKIKFKKEKPKGINTSISQFRARRGNKLFVRSRVYIVTGMQVGCVILSYTIKSIPLIILRNIFKAILLLHSLKVHLFSLFPYPKKS